MKENNKSYMKSVLDDLTDMTVIEESMNSVDIKVYGKYISLVSGPNGNLLIFIYNNKEDQCADRCENIQLIDSEELKQVKLALGCEE